MGVRSLLRSTLIAMVVGLPWGGAWAQSVSPDLSQGSGDGASGFSLSLQSIAGGFKEFAVAGTSFVYYAAVVVGLWLCFSAIHKIIQKGMPGKEANDSWGSIVMRMVWSGCLATLASKLQMLIAINGSSVEPLRDTMAYAQGAAGSDPTMQLIWAAISAWCVFIGTIGLMRGFMLWDKATQGGHESGDAFWRGLWHLFFSALTIQIFS